jgi:hypothetical protein
MGTALHNTSGVVSKQVSFRTTDSNTDQRVARLVKHLKSLPQYKGIKVSDSTVHNMAYLRGLDLLEEELGLGKKPRRK